MIQDKNWKVRKEGLDKLKVSFLLIRRFHFSLSWAFFSLHAFLLAQGGLCYQLLGAFILAQGGFSSH
jgi:hypothetical protein